MRSSKHEKELFLQKFTFLDAYINIRKYEYSIVNIMAGNYYVNLFYLTYDAINVIKKKDLVDYIEKMKAKVVHDKQI